MGWKSVAVVGCLFPVFAGCATTHCGTHNAANEIGWNHTQSGIEHALRKDAHAAWRSVRRQYPHRTFTAEFRDGFLDGYADYLNRGGAAQPPAVPPVKYVRDKKYFTPQGHCLINDYYLGFQYGVDVAVASGHRQFLTVPALLPDKAHAPGESPAGPTTPTVPDPPIKPKQPSSDSLPPPRQLPEPGDGNAFGAPKKPDDPPEIPFDQGAPFQAVPSPFPGGAPKRSIPPLPKPELPVIKPLNPNLSGGKVPALPVPPDPDLLPVPNPPLPLPGPDLGPLPVPVPRSEPLPVPPPEEVKSDIPRILQPLPVRVPALKLGLSPEPGEDPPALSTTTLPPILGDIPVIPFRLTPAVPDVPPFPSQK